MTHPSQHKTTSVDMDAAAKLAEAEFDKVFQPALEDDVLAPGIEWLVGWFKRWYLLAGHKRLGRMLVKRAKDLPRRDRDGDAPRGNIVMPSDPSGPD
jgi:hypothetical protein